MTKKNYMKPEMRSYQIEAASILAASSNYARPEDDQEICMTRFHFTKVMTIVETLSRK